MLLPFLQTPTELKLNTPTKTVVVEKKERKIYDLPGQKHDPPEEVDPLRSLKHIESTLTTH